MSLLTLVQDVFMEVGIAQTRPNAVITSTDANVLQLLALANTTGEALMKRYAWQELMVNSTFTATGTIAQGSVGFVFGADYDRLVPQTFWDRSQRIPIDGPVTTQQFQADQSNLVAGPPYYFFIFGNQVCIGPTALNAGDTCSVFYISQDWCQSSAGVNQSSFQADDDVTRIPERLFRLDLIWRWKRAKGLSYAEELATAEEQIETAIGGNRSARVLYFGGRNILYPTNIPEGYWPS